MAQLAKTSNLSKAHERHDSRSTSCSQIVSIDLQPFCRNPHPWSVHHSRKSQQTLKPPNLWAQGHSRSSMSIPLKSLPSVLVMISSMSMPICNCFHARSTNIDKITTFQKGPLFDTCVRRLVWTLWGQHVDCYNLHLMLKITCAGCLGLSKAISS